MAQINLRKMSRELHSDAKIAAIQCRMTLEEFVLAAIREKVNKVNNEGKRGSEL